MEKNGMIKLYYRLRENKATFRLIIRLKELGVNKLLKDIIGVNKKIEVTPAKMKEAQLFYNNNIERINKMLSTLADEKSREVWNAVMQYRMKGKTIPKSLWSDTDQYFVKNIIHIEKEEVFVDGGAFIGDTIQHLMNASKRMGGSIKRIIAFEPDENNIRQIHRNFHNNNRIEVIAKGLSNEDKILLFSPNGSMGYFINENISNNIQEDYLKIECTSIDCRKECADATFIKMDIEGCEMEALEGAKNTITQNHPKLAICIYHSLEDMVRIAEYIHKEYPMYKLYVRHHTASDEETVLYAVCE